MKLLTGRSNPELAQQISKYTETPLTPIEIKNFADDEIFARVRHNVRGEDVFVVQSTCKPANDNLMELLIIIDALRRGFARSIIAVIPYFGYARQDRKTQPRTPISARLVANMLEKAGVNRILTVDLHAAQIQGFFDIPVDNLYSTNLIVDDIIKTSQDNSNLVVVSPDHGGVARARAFSSVLEKRGNVKTSLVIIDKRRPEAGKAEVMNIIGDPKGKNCILVDDIVDSGGTLCKAATALKQAGAQSVRAYATHGVLSNNAVQNINQSALSSMVITDTIAQKSEKLADNSKVRLISAANLLGEAIVRIRDNKSVSSLFD